ncbi:MAG: flagellar basal-body rod protein FlgF [Burkholderiales bacterium]|nr:flagellar basal-body rod protein FlgF [Burkholderiales bacterium]OJX09120.1 MAG: flagellar basal-body rod protein FlgF [Burkholderiales bacterium 70-64]
MDRMIYLSMSGAKALMQRQDALAHNLANGDTAGFRADRMAFRAVPGEQRDAATTRVWALEASAGFDAQQGPLRQTGRALDVAVSGSGWFAVQTASGDEAYTRDGSFEVGADGTLQNRRGQPVLGDGGTLSIPPGAEVSIGSDGTVSARIGNQPPFQVGRLKLVNPQLDELRKDADGLVRMRTGDEAPVDESVRIVTGSVEGSNVNMVESMVGMIALTRQFEMQMRMLQTAESNEQKAAQLLSSKA